MNELQKVEIVDTEMTVREYKGQRVVTFKDIDAVHKRPSGTTRKAFNRNKNRLQEGTDYFSLKYKDDKKNSNVHEMDISLDSKVHEMDLKNITVPNRGITVLTESGYLLLVKVFDDDLAWQVQRALVNTYFRAKEEHTIPKITLSEPDRKPFRISTTPVPRNPNWFQRNYRRMGYICKAAGIGRSRLYHDILVYLGEEFNLDEARRIYQEELGEPPQYALDIVSYFPELAELADCILNQLEMEL